VVRHTDTVFVTNGGVKREYRFQNGYGASVVCHEYSYGGRDGLWELAVLKYDGDKPALCYDTPITSDVVGYLSDDEVDALLDQIEALPGAAS
jgi:hypothetical protein